MPIEPTEEMSTAGKRYLKGAETTFERILALGVYNVMLAAAPSPEHLHMLHEISDAVMALREARGKPDIECVVVENDWPEYGLVWQLIEDRTQGRNITDSYEKVVNEICNNLTKG